MGAIGLLYVTANFLIWAGIAYCAYWLFSEPEKALPAMAGLGVLLLVLRFVGGSLLKGTHSIYKELE